MLSGFIELDPYLQTKFSPTPNEMKTGVSPETYSVMGIFMQDDGFDKMEMMTSEQYVNHVKTNISLPIFDNAYQFNSSVVVGLHDNKHTVTHIKMLQASGAVFHDAQLAQ